MTRVLWLVWALCVPTATLSAQTYLVVVAGLGGEARYRDAFHSWAVELIGAATERYGVSADRISYLGESVARDPARISARSSMDDIARTLADVAQRAEPEALVVVVLIGHGSTRDGEPTLNLPGPDLTATELARLLQAFPTQTLVVANLASASGDFIPALSGPRRAIITATKSSMERDEARFGRYFVDAFAGGQADVDHDGAVSMLEAFTYARREVARSYGQEGTLVTEHALLDDNGDKTGSYEPDPTTTDGAFARTITFGPIGAKATTRDPELAALYTKKQSIERAIAALQGDKARLDSADYERRLEAMLLELATTNRSIREREDGAP